MILYHTAASIGEHVLDCQYTMLARIENGLIADMWTGTLHPQETRRFWAALHEDQRSALESR